MLNPDQFFHGTRSAIKDGMVRSANDVDKDVSEYSMGDPGEMSEGDHAFAIRNDEMYAWHAAHNFHQNNRRPRVYEVGPAADMKPGPWNKEHPDFLAHHELDETAAPDEIAYARKYDHQDEWASKTGFPVRKRIDIMPGRQGTFPDINWNRFKSAGSYRVMDSNHPTHEAAAMGTDHEFHHKHALDLNEKYDADRNPQARRTGASLRAFMMGKPEPEPKPDPTLF